MLLRRTKQTSQHDQEEGFEERFVHGEFFTSLQPWFHTILFGLNGLTKDSLPLFDLARNMRSGYLRDSALAL